MLTVCVLAVVTTLVSGIISGLSTTIESAMTRIMASAAAVVLLVVGTAASFALVAGFWQESLEQQNERGYPSVTPPMFIALLAPALSMGPALVVAILVAGRLRSIRTVSGLFPLAGFVAQVVGLVGVIAVALTVQATVTTTAHESFVQKHGVELVNPRVPVAASKASGGTYVATASAPLSSSDTTWFSVPILADDGSVRLCNITTLIEYSDAALVCEEART